MMMHFCHNVLRQSFSPADGDSSCNCCAVSYQLLMAVPETVVPATRGWTAGYEAAMDGGRSVDGVVDIGLDKRWSSGRLGPTQYTLARTAGRRSGPRRAGIGERPRWPVRNTRGGRPTRMTSGQWR